jgi:hypothetical protein
MVQEVAKSAVCCRWKVTWQPRCDNRSHNFFNPAEPWRPHGPGGGEECSVLPLEGDMAAKVRQSFT